MKKIIFALIFIFVYLAGISLVCAGDVADEGVYLCEGNNNDFNINDIQGDRAINPPEWEGPNVDNYHFEGEYPTPEEIDELAINNIPDDLYDNVIMMDTSLVDHENIYFMDSADSKIGDTYSVEKASHESAILSCGNAPVHCDLINNLWDIRDSSFEREEGSFRISRATYSVRVASIVAILLDSKGNVVRDAMVRISWAGHTKIITNENGVIVFVEPHEDEHCFCLESMGKIKAKELVYLY